MVPRAAPHRNPTRRSSNSARTEQAMLDIALLITGIVFFAICEIYARICERL
jgi:uncharacterized membrane protein